LIAKPILIPAVRALPGDGIAGHAPQVFLHTFLTNTESAPAPPAEGKFPSAAVANILAEFAALSPQCAFTGCVFHACCFFCLIDIGSPAIVELLTP